MPNLKTLGNASRSHAFVVSAFTSCLPSWVRLSHPRVVWYPHLSRRCAQHTSAAPTRVPSTIYSRQMCGPCQAPHLVWSTAVRHIGLTQSRVCALTHSHWLPPTTAFSGSLSFYCVVDLCLTHRSSPVSSLCTHTLALAGFLPPLTSGSLSFRGLRTPGVFCGRPLSDASS